MPDHDDRTDARPDGPGQTTGDQADDRRRSDRPGNDRRAYPRLIPAKRLQTGDPAVTALQHAVARLFELVAETGLVDPEALGSAVGDLGPLGWELEPPHA